MNKIIFIIFIFFASYSNAQHETDYWYFGNYAGLDFSSGEPEPLVNSQLKTYEGCSSISDSLGNLLFYTNGITVWNKNHQIMENGTDLSGDTSSTQSAIIVQQPGNDSIYFIFTTDELSVNKNLITKGLNYSVVNINTNGGYGNVIQKNINLYDSICEKITVVKHQNKKDFWIITHDWGSNAYYVWLLNQNGLNITPVISNIGTQIGNDQRMSIGYMKASPDGSKIATAIWLLSKWEIFDFNNQSGILSNPIQITRPYLYSAYSCEFSPDASKLYISAYDTLMQADMNAGNQIDIQNSLTVVGIFNSPVGAIQNANNGKIYITNDFADSLSVINYPDGLPESCDFEKNAVYLDGKKARLGLPNFNQSYFSEHHFRAFNFCFGDSTFFTVTNNQNIDSVIWNFGDPASGNKNTNKLQNPKHRFSTYGLFRVKLTVWYNNNFSDYFSNIKIVAPPPINLGKDTTLCEADSLILSAYSPHYSYFWNTSSTDSAITIYSNGTYYVEIENIYTLCKNSDTIQVIFSEIPEINIGDDRSFCENTHQIINAWHNGYTYTWQEGSHNSYFETDTAGTFFVHVKNSAGCKNSDTVKLSIINIPIFDLGKDTVFCEGHFFTLNPKLSNVDYLWQDGSTDSIYYASETGTYNLNTKNICGTWSDSIHIEFRYCGPVYIPNVFSPNEDGINDLFKIKGIDKENWSLTIYNRWGNEVYCTPDYKNNWKAKNIENGVYYYILSNPEKKQTYKGSVRVIK